jgi:hypothetical protein
MCFEGNSVDPASSRGRSASKQTGNTASDPTGGGSSAAAAQAAADDSDDELLNFVIPGLNSALKASAVKAAPDVVTMLSDDEHTDAAAVGGSSKSSTGGKRKLTRTDGKPVGSAKGKGKSNLAAAVAAAAASATSDITQFLAPSTALSTAGSASASINTGVRADSIFMPATCSDGVTALTLIADLDEHEGRLQHQEHTVHVKHVSSVYKGSTSLLVNELSAHKREQLALLCSKPEAAVVATVTAEASCTTPQSAASAAVPTEPCTASIAKSEIDEVIESTADSIHTAEKAVTVDNNNNQLQQASLSRVTTGRRNKLSLKRQRSPVQSDITNSNTSPQQTVKLLSTDTDANEQQQQSNDAADSSSNGDDTMQIDAQLHEATQLQCEPADNDMSIDDESSSISPTNATAAVVAAAVDDDSSHCKEHSATVNGAVDDSQQVDTSQLESSSTRRRMQLECDFGSSQSDTDDDDDQQIQQEQQQQQQQHVDIEDCAELQSPAKQTPPVVQHQVCDTC